MAVTVTAQWVHDIVGLFPVGIGSNISTTGTAYASSEITNFEAYKAILGHTGSMEWCSEHESSVPQY